MGWNGARSVSLGWGELQSLPLEGHQAACTFPAHHCPRSTISHIKSCIGSDFSRASHEKAFQPKQNTPETPHVAPEHSSLIVSPTRTPSGRYL